MFDCLGCDWQKHQWLRNAVIMWGCSRYFVTNVFLKTRLWFEVVVVGCMHSVSRFPRKAGTKCCWPDCTPDIKSLVCNTVAEV